MKSPCFTENDKIPNTGYEMNTRIKTSGLLISLFLLLFSVPSSLAAQNEENTENKEFGSVEERRIHATIQQERTQILEERKQLKLREKELKTLEDAVDKKLAEIDQKLLELKKSKQELAALLQQKDEQEAKKLQSLGKIYEKMDPMKAALAISGLDQELAADLLANMKVKAAAKILDNLNKPKATELSKTFSTIQLE